MASSIVHACYTLVGVANKLHPCGLLQGDLVNGSPHCRVKQVWPITALIMIVNEDHSHSYIHDQYWELTANRFGNSENDSNSELPV